MASIRSTKTRDFRREEDRVITRIDRSNRNGNGANGGRLPPGFTQRQRCDTWRVPLIEMIPDLSERFLRMMGGGRGFVT